MANTMKKTTTKSSTVTEKVENTEVKNTEVKSVPVEKKSYGQTDLILCKSITNGLLLATGARSGLLYRWADYGDEEGIEYQDLLYMVRSKDVSVYEPRFIIEDEDFVKQNPQLESLYESLYTTQDIKDVLMLPANRLRAAIEKLPAGVQKSLKGVASSMIDNGSFDSVAKIKILDEYFDTKMLLTLAQK